MTDADATRLSGGDSDATRFAGESYRTRLAQGTAATPDDKTRLAQEGYQSKLARDAAGMQSDAGEFYKLGDKIGDRYEVSAIHHGAMGVVYGCFDHVTKFPRALKTVRSRHLHDMKVISQFEDEAAVWISLEKHPYIVRAYKVELFNKLPYVITEYVRGPEGMEGDLRGWLGHPRLTLPVAVAMALQIAQGMQHAVRKVSNLVHRDLKPGNILVNGDGKVMVTDFGLVNAADSGAGTPAYMSPEQWREDTLDMRSDIYAYGCILFEMFTAHRLFHALTERDWKIAHLESMPAALTNLISELPSEIDQFVSCCLEKDKGARPQSWDEVVAFFADWYHRLTGNAVVFDFSSLELSAAEWLDSGYSLVALNRLNEANHAIDQALAINQGILNAWFYKGTVLYGLKRYDEAIHAYDRALKIRPNSFGVWFQKGNVFRELKRYEDAIQAYDREIEIAPNHVDAWVNKGNMLSELKRYDEAILAYDRALSIDQNLINPQIFKGGMLFKLKRYDDSIQAFDRAIEINPTSFFAHHIKSLILRDLNRNEEANRAFDQVLAIDQNHIETLIEKGRVLYKLNRYVDAIQSLDRALALAPNHVNGLITKGTALYKLNRCNEAIQVFDRILAIDPNNFLAWSKKGIALFNLKRYEESIHSQDRALAIDPNNAGALQLRNSAVDALKVDLSPRYSWKRFWNR